MSISVKSFTVFISCLCFKVFKFSVFANFLQSYGDFFTLAILICDDSRKFSASEGKGMGRNAYLCAMIPHFEIAIVDSNILAALGLQQLLTDIIPMAEIRTFISFDELQAADRGQFVHYFVASRLYFEHTAFFRENVHRSIVLVNGDLQISGVPTLNVCQNEQALVKSILAMHGHSGHRAQEMAPHRPQKEPPLSLREIEVAILLAKGFINKEIADRLNISVTTVITHRKNIMEKLHARSLADIIIYVVMNGLVEVGEL